MQTLPLPFLQMPHPDPMDTKETLPATLWWFQFIAIDAASSTATVQADGFRDEQAFLDWFADHASAQVIGPKVYTVSGATFWALFGAIMGGQMSLYDAVKSLSAADDTPELDANKQPVLTSFFANATQVIVNVPVGG